MVFGRASGQRDKSSGDKEMIRDDISQVYEEKCLGRKKISSSVQKMSSDEEMMNSKCDQFSLERKESCDQDNIFGGYSLNYRARVVDRFRPSNQDNVSRTGGIPNLKSPTIILPSRNLRSGVMQDLIFCRNDSSFHAHLDHTYHSSQAYHSKSSLTYHSNQAETGVRSNIIQTDPDSGVRKDKQELKTEDEADKYGCDKIATGDESKELLEGKQPERSSSDFVNTDNEFPNCMDTTNYSSDYAGSTSKDPCDEIKPTGGGRCQNLKSGKEASEDTEESLKPSGSEANTSNSSLDESERITGSYDTDMPGVALPPSLRPAVVRSFQPSTMPEFLLTFQPRVWSPRPFLYTSHPPQRTWEGYLPPGQVLALLLSGLESKHCRLCGGRLNISETEILKTETLKQKYFWCPYCGEKEYPDGDKCKPETECSGVSNYGSVVPERGGLLCDGYNVNWSKIIHPDKHSLMMDSGKLFVLDSLLKRLEAQF